MKQQQEKEILNLFNTSIMIPVKDISQVSERDRLFYELGHKININNMNYVDNWINTGKFKEIMDVRNFLLKDNLLLNTEYLKHHNFMMIKNK